MHLVPHGRKAKSRFSYITPPLQPPYNHTHTHRDPCEPPQPLTFPANPCPPTLSCKQVEAGEVAMVEVVGGVLISLVAWKTRVPSFPFLVGASVLRFIEQMSASA